MLLADLAAYSAELCLYVSTVGYLISMIGPVRPVLLSAVVLFLTECLVSLLRNKKRVLRLLALLPALCLFYPLPSFAAFLYPLPMLVLIFTRAFSGAVSAGRENVRSMFRLGTAAFAVMLFCLSLNGGLDGFSKVFPYFTVFLLLTVLSMRLLRNENTTPGREVTALNLLLMLLALVAGFLLSSEAGLAVLKAAGNFFLQYMLIPVLMLCVGLLIAIPGLLIWLIAKLISLIPFHLEDAEEAEPWSISGFDPGTLEAEALRELPAWLKQAGIGLLVLGGLFLCWLLAKRMLVRRRMPGRGTETVRTRIEGSEERRQGFTLSRSPDTVIRRCYRKYLGLCRKLSLRTDGTLLSDTLRDASSLYTGPATETLRTLWIKARYSPLACTGEEADAARAALKEIRACFRKAFKA